MRKGIICILALQLLFFAGCRNNTKAEQPEELKLQANMSGNVQDSEWVILFDGTSLDAWKGYLQDEVPEGWNIRDGALFFDPPEVRREGVNYNLVSRDTFTDFVLSIEWQISDGGNSGIFWGVYEDPKYGQPYETGPEIQVLDNSGHPDAKNGTTHQAGALYDMVAPSEDLTLPVGKWNRTLITVNHKTGKGSVELNGKPIVEFPLANAAWDAMVAKSKFAGWEGFAKYQTGKIGLQDHGDPVAFRNIKIKPL